MRLLAGYRTIPHCEGLQRSSQPILSPWWGKHRVIVWRLKFPKCFWTRVTRRGSETKLEVWGLRWCSRGQFERLWEVRVQGTVRWAATSPDGKSLGSPEMWPDKLLPVVPRDAGNSGQIAASFTEGPQQCADPCPRQRSSISTTVLIVVGLMAA